MNESKLYLNYFKKNFLIIVLPALVFLVIGIIYQINKPTTYQLSRLYEFEYTQDNIQQVIPLVDQAITQIRSQQLREDLKIEDVNTFKPGPLSMIVTVGSSRRERLEGELNKIDIFLKQKYELVKVGQDILKNQKPDLIFIPALISSIGFLLGLTISLIKSYLRNY